MAKWETKAEILFTSNGEKVMRSLSEWAAKLEKSLKLVTDQAAETTVAFDEMAAAAERAAAAMASMARASSTSTSASDTATAGSYRASTAYNTVSAAATRATASVIALGRAQRAGILPPAIPRIALPSAGQTSLGSGSDYTAPDGHGTGRAIRIPFGYQRGMYPQDTVASPNTSWTSPGPGTLGGNTTPNPRAWGAQINRGVGGSGGGGSIPPTGGGGSTSPGGSGGNAAAIGSAIKRTAANTAAGVSGFVTGIAGNIARRSIEGAVLGGIVGAGDAIYSAANLDMINTTIGNVTGASPKQMAALRAQEISLAQQYDMTSTQSAEMARDVFRGTKGTMSFEDSQKMFKVIAEEQLVLGNTRKFTPQQTTDAAITMSHLFRSYDAKGFEHMADIGLRLAELSPNNLNQANTQFTLMEPILKTLGVKDEDAAALYVTLSRAGLGKGKGGAGVADLVGAALGPLQLTKHAQVGKAKILKELGVMNAQGDSTFFTADKNGKPKGDIIGFLDQLSKDRDKLGPEKFAQYMHSAFGIQGGKIADLLADDVIHKNLTAIVPLLHSTQATVGLHHQSETIAERPKKAMDQAAKDFQTMLTTIGHFTLPTVNKGFRDLSKEMDWVTNWLEHHQGETARWSASLTRALVNGEQFLVRHKSDFEEMGKAAQGAFNVIAALWPEFKLVGDISMTALGKLSKVISAIEDFATKVLNIIGPFVPTAGAPVVPQALDPTTHTRYDWSRHPAVQPKNTKPIETPHPYLTRFQLGHGLPTPPTPARPTSAKPKQTSQVQSHTTIGNVAIHIHGIQDAKAVAKQVQIALMDIAKSPRSQMAISGFSRTRHDIPINMSVGVG